MSNFSTETGQEKTTKPHSKPTFVNLARVVPGPSPDAGNEAQMMGVYLGRPTFTIEESVVYPKPVAVHLRAQVQEQYATAFQISVCGKWWGFPRAYQAVPRSNPFETLALWKNYSTVMNLLNIT
jgi:hypothetical protein